MSVLNIVGQLLTGGAVDKIVDLVDGYQQKRLSKEQLKFELETLTQRQAQEQILAGADIIKTEAKSTHFLTASWRPILMLVITTIVAMHYLIFPVANLFLAMPLALELPAELWDLLTIGVGGYVVGRSGEKMMQEYKRK